MNSFEQFRMDIFSLKRLNSLVFQSKSKIKKVVIMDLNKMNNEKKLELCRWYYRAGFVFLPFLWCVNAVWFFQEAFKKPPYDQQREIKKYVIFSGIGGLVWIVVLTIWIIVFQTNRAAWGEIADTISFMIPAGIP